MDACGGLDAEIWHSLGLNDASVLGMAARIRRSGRSNIAVRNSDGVEIARGRLVFGALLSVIWKCRNQLRIPGHWNICSEIGRGSADLESKGRDLCDFPRSTDIDSAARQLGALHRAAISPGVCTLHSKSRRLQRVTLAQQCLRPRTTGASYYSLALRFPVVDPTSSKHRYSASRLPKVQIDTMPQGSADHRPLTTCSLPTVQSPECHRSLTPHSQLLLAFFDASSPHVPPPLTRFFAPNVCWRSLLRSQRYISADRHKQRALKADWQNVMVSCLCLRRTACSDWRGRLSASARVSLNHR